MFRKLSLTVVAIAIFVLGFLANTIGITGSSATEQQTNRQQKKYRYECWSTKEPNKPRQGTCYYDRRLAQQEGDSHQKNNPSHSGSVVIEECK